MAIEKVYSLDITKGRCKDSDEWEIYDVKTNHKGYSPIERLVVTTNPLLVGEYECDEYFDTYLDNKFEYGVYVYNSKYVNGGVSKPKLIYGAGNDLDIPEEISEKYLATEDNPNVPFVKNIMFPCGGGCPLVLTDYGVFSACDTNSTLFNYDGKIHTDNVMYKIGKSVIFKSNGIWSAKIDDEYIFDDTFTLITAYGSENDCNETIYFYNNITGEVFKYDSSNSVEVITTLQTGLTRYNEEGLAPILKDNDNNIYFFNIDNYTLERIDNFIEYNNGIIFKDECLKYRKNNNDIYDIIAPNDFEIEKIKGKIVNIEYIPRERSMGVYSNENPIEMFFVDNDGLIDIYIFNENIIYKCITDNKNRIKTNDFKYLGFHYEDADATNASSYFLDYCYIFISSNNTLFTIYNYVCYPSIIGKNYSRLVKDRLYESTNNIWYIIYDYTTPSKVNAEKFTYMPTLFNLEPIGEEIILGNIYEIYPQIVRVEGKDYTTDDAYGYILKTKDYSIVPKITYEVPFGFNTITTTNFYDYYMAYWYKVVSSGDDDNYWEGYKCLPINFPKNNISDLSYVEIPLYDNIIPNGIFYSTQRPKNITIIQNSVDTLTFGDFSFYDSRITNCYAKNIKLGYKAIAETPSSNSSYEFAPILHAPYGADYSKEYENHPLWYKPTYDLIPIDEYTKTLKFEFSGDSVDVKVDGVTKTFTSSPVEVEVEHSWIINAGSSTITKYCTLPLNDLSNHNTDEYIRFTQDLEIIDGTELNKYTFSKRTETAFRKDNAKEIIWNGFIKLSNNLNKFIDECESLEKVSINDTKFVKEGNFHSGGYGYFTLNVVDMINECPNLKNVSMDGWDVENMIVSGCPFNDTLTSLETVSMKNWNAKNTTFNNCLFSSGLTNLQTIDLIDSSKELYQHIAKCLEDNNLSNVKVILKPNSTPSNETLKISFSGDNISFKLNNKTYNAIYNPYTTTLTDMGIVQLRNCNNAFNSSSLTEIISFPDTSSVIDMSYMFKNCSGLTSINLTDWDTSNVANMGAMFSGCKSLTELDLSDWDTSSVTNMSGMFYECSGLTSINITDWDTSNVTNMGSMFSGCTSLATIDLSGWNTSSLTDMTYMFKNCSGLTSINLSGWDISNVNGMSSTFDGCPSLTSLNLNNCKIGNIGFGSIYHLIEDFSTIDTSNVTDMTEMFKNCSGLTSINITDWDTSNVTDMTNMFYRCASLTTIDLSGWNTSSLTDMTYMFNYCSGLTSINLSGWDISKITDMSSTFNGCKSLTSLNLNNCKIGNIDFGSFYHLIEDFSTIDTSSVTDMSYMFQKCSGLTSINITDWDTSNVTNMSWLFNGCTSLTSIDLSNWNTSNVTNMRGIFYGCTNLATIDLSGWNTSSLTDMANMFINCKALQTLKIKQGTYDWWYARLSDASLQNQVTIIEV